MKNQTRNLQSDDLKIEEIIDSFHDFAIRDIRVNIENPIAAFILCSCLIDQLAAFRYNHPHNKNGEYYRKFIDEYLPRYNSLKLYENLRCGLVHNYSISEYLAITSDHPLEDLNSTNVNVNLVTVKRLLKDLETAFEKLRIEFKSETTARKNAIERFKDSPPLILVNRGMWQYSEDEADYLIKYYSPLLIGKLMNEEKSLKIDTIEKSEISAKVFIVRCISIKDQRKYEANLDEIATQLSLIYPIEVLKIAGLHKT